MKKIKLLIFACLLCSIFTGCGHSIVRVDRGTGLMARIPLPDGSSLIEIKAGKIDSITTILKGNSMVDSLSATGGSIFGAAGDSSRTIVKTNPQLNEGYLAQVLMDPNLDKETKNIIAMHLLLQQAPNETDGKAVTIGAAAGSGQNGVKQVKPKSSGVDNVVDKVSDTINQVAPVVKDGTVSVSKSVQNSFVGTSYNIADIFKNVKSVVAIIVVFIMAIICIFVIYKSTHKKQ